LELREKQYVDIVKSLNALLINGSGVTAALPVDNVADISIDSVQFAV
jgi:hypothetical protein